MTEHWIRLYVVREDGTYADARDDFTLSDFGGVLPAVGDLIVDPGVRQDLDRDVAANRTVYEVVARYFQPLSNPKSEHHYSCVLVCTDRRGQDFEADIVTHY